MVEEKTDIDTGQPIPKPAPHKKPKAKKIMLALGAFILLAGIAAGGWYWRDKDAKKLQNSQQVEISQLKEQVSKLEADLATEQAKTKAASEDAQATSGPQQSVLNNIKDAISSGNTAALEGYMADNVLVILAASEGLGKRTASQATADTTSYLKEATDPWDFDLTDETLDKYSAGDYAQYFPSGSLVGQSKNDYVISFTFNNAGDISVVFMSVSSDLL